MNPYTAFVIVVGVLFLVCLGYLVWFALDMLRHPTPAEAGDWQLWLETNEPVTNDIPKISYPPAP